MKFQWTSRNLFDVTDESLGGSLLPLLPSGVLVLKDFSRGFAKITSWSPLLFIGLLWGSKAFTLFPSNISFTLIGLQCVDNLQSGRQ